MSSYLSSAGQGVSNFGQGVGKGVTGIGQGVGKGVGEIGKGVGKGVGDIGKGVGIGGNTTTSTEGQNNSAKNNEGGTSTEGGGVDGNSESKTTTSIEGQNNSAKSSTTAPTNTANVEGAASTGGGLGGALNALGGSAKQGLGAFGNAGMSIAGSVSKIATDLNRNVAKGVGVVGGTAIEQVVNLAALTTDSVLAPISNSLKAIEGLEALGEGVDSINGISKQALHGLGDAAKKALEVAGRTPTFFNQSGDGIVKMSDTRKGFVAIGLEEKYARIAAYALHSSFSYPTSESWNPVPLIAPNSGYEFPIKIENMSKTKWGRNWGNFERVDWVQDADVERFFGMRSQTTWTEYWTDIKSYFGTALLIFEWGTTWPYMPVPGSDLAAGQIGAIFRTVILPTIVKTHENAEKKSGGEPPKREQGKMPSPPPLQKQEEGKA